MILIMGCRSPKLRQHRQQIKRGEFVGGDGQLAALQFAQFGQRLGGVVAQIQQPLGVFLQNASCVGEQAVARGTVEERLADFVFQLVDGLADRRLGAIQLFRRAGKPPLARHRQEDFQLCQSP